MYSFIYNMYSLGRINEETVMAFVGKGCITQEQAESIIEGK